MISKLIILIILVVAMAATKFIATVIIGLFIINEIMEKYFEKYYD